MDDGINWAELERRRGEYELVGTLKEGTKHTPGPDAARSLGHPLDRYLKRETIKQRQYDAGMRLMGDYIVATHSLSASSFDGVPAPKQFFSRSPSDAKIDASRRVESAFKFVGRTGRIVLTELILFETTLEIIGKRVDMNRKEVPGALKLALNDLADYYRLPE